MVRLMKATPMSTFLTSLFFKISANISFADHARLLILSFILSSLVFLSRFFFLLFLREKNYVSVI